MLVTAWPRAPVILFNIRVLQIDFACNLLSHEDLKEAGSDDRPDTAHGTLP
jgi:hypothetical protein